MVNSMDTHFISEKDDALKKDAFVKSYGSVQGALEASPCGGEGRFVITEAQSGKAVQCVLRDELVHKAKVSIGRDVSVFGEKLSSKDGKSNAITGWKMRVLPLPEDIPTIDEIVGICPDMTGGLPSEVYARKQFYGD